MVAKVWIMKNEIQTFFGLKIGLKGLDLGKNLNVTKLWFT